MLLNLSLFPWLQWMPLKLELGTWRLLYAAPPLANVFQTFWNLRIVVEGSASSLHQKRTATAIGWMLLSTTSRWQVCNGHMRKWPSDWDNQFNVPALLWTFYTIMIHILNNLYGRLSIICVLFNFFFLVCLVLFYTRL